MSMKRRLFERDRYGRTITLFGRTYEIGAGTDDDVTVYANREFVYVVTENFRLEYIGLEVFSREDGSLEFDIFFQAESEDKDWLLRISRYPTRIRYMCQWWDAY